MTESSGSTHILCIGENGACQSGAQGPSELTSANGMQVDPGQTKQVKFDTAGTYKITCTIHPTMNMTHHRPIGRRLTRYTLGPRFAGGLSFGHDDSI